MSFEKSPYSTREKAARILWKATEHTVFRATFHNWDAPRRALLRLFGARVAPSARVRRTVRVECPWNLEIGASSVVGEHAQLYCLGKVKIRERVMVSQNAHLCAGTHDFEKPHMPLVRSPIEIGDDAWIAADAFVGPGVIVGPGAILGARGCAAKDLDPWTIYAGNPARPLRARSR